MLISRFNSLLLWLIIIALLSSLVLFASDLQTLSPSSTDQDESALASGSDDQSQSEISANPSAEQLNLTADSLSQLDTDTLVTLQNRKSSMWRDLIVPLSFTVAIGGILLLLFTQRGN